MATGVSKDAAAAAHAAAGVGLITSVVQAAVVNIPRRHASAQATPAAPLTPVQEFIRDAAPAYNYIIVMANGAISQHTKRVECKEESDGTLTRSAVTIEEPIRSIAFNLATPVEAGSTKHTIKDSGVTYKVQSGDKQKDGHGPVAVIYWNQDAKGYTDIHFMGELPNVTAEHRHGCAVVTDTQNISGQQRLSYVTIRDCNRSKIEDEHGRITSQSDPYTYTVYNYAVDLTMGARINQLAHSRRSAAPYVSFADQVRQGLGWDARTQVQPEPGSKVVQK